MCRYKKKENQALNIFIFTLSFNIIVTRQMTFFKRNLNIMHMFHFILSFHFSFFFLPLFIFSISLSFTYTLECIS